ncbi:MAG: hypothetical protein ACJA02_001118 [Myxococcota bacterium]
MKFSYNKLLSINLLSKIEITGGKTGPDPCVEEVKNKVKNAGLKLLMVGNIKPLIAMAILLIWN